MFRERRGGRRMGAVGMHLKMAEGAALFRPTSFNDAGERYGRG
jgi:hypothetical protein